MKTWTGKKPPARKQTRDYASRSYGNPLFSARTQRGRDRRGSSGLGKKILLGLIIAAPLALIGLLSWYFLVGPAFRIEGVDVSGASPETEALVRVAVESKFTERKLLVFPQSNIFNFSESQTRKKIGGVVALDELVIRKKLPHSLMIEVKEKPLAATYITSSRIYGIGVDGGIVRELSERELRKLRDLPSDLQAVNLSELDAESVSVTEIQDPNSPVPEAKPQLPIIRDGEEVDGAKAPLPGKKVMEPTMLEFIARAYAELAGVAGSRPLWFTAKPSAETVEASMEGGWQVFFSSATPFEVQASRLSVVLKEKIGDKKSQLEYVDLRYDERIFFRLKNQPAKE